MRSNLVQRSALIAILLSSAVVTAPVAAAPGDLDPGFGEDGIVKIDRPTKDIFSSVSVLDDGRIVAGGFVCENLDCDFTVARFTVDGEPDGTFGTDGMVTTDLGADDRAHGIDVDADGRYLVAGSTCSNVGDCDFALARYDGSGALDDAFGTGGLVVTDLGGEDQGSAVAVDGDRIIVAGHTCSAPSGCDFAVARFDGDGILDPVFGGLGHVSTDVSEAELGDEAEDVVVRGDGKILVGGSTCAESLACNFAIALYDPAGALEDDFGNDGIVTTSFGGHEAINSLILQEDGKIIGSGFTCRPGSDCDFALARFWKSGKIDEGFGQKGMAVTSFGAMERAHDIVIQDDDKVLAVGTSCSSEDDCDLAMARYGPKGAADATFGVNGRVTLDLGGNDGALAASRHVPRRAVVAGGADGDGVLLSFRLGRSILREPSVVSAEYRQAKDVLRGKVDSARRRCRSKRKVELRRRGDGGIATRTTDRRGRWKFAGIHRDGRYWVKVGAKQFVTGSGVKIICEKTRSIDLRVRG